MASNTTNDTLGYINNSLKTKYDSSLQLDHMVNVYRAYVSPIVSVVGVLGNLIVLIVFSTEGRKTRFTVYCIVLAITDTTALVTNSLMDDFLGRGLKHLNYTEIKFDTMSTPLCKFMEYIPNVAYFASSYILICFSFDRVLTICNPVKFYSEHFLRGAIIVCCVTIGISACINGPMAVSNRLVQREDGHMKCTTPDSEIISQFALYLKVIFAFSIPTLAILIINGIIVAKILIIHSARRRLLSNPKENRMEMGRVVGHFVVSTMFFLLNLPLVIVMLLRLNSKPAGWDIHYPELFDNLVPLSRLVSSIKDINYGVNFFLYFVFLSMFRWRFFALFCGCCVESRALKRYSCFNTIRRGISRYERQQPSSRKRSAIATLAQQVTHNALGVANTASVKRRPYRPASTTVTRPHTIELTTDAINSDSYNTHL